MSALWRRCCEVASAADERRQRLWGVQGRAVSRLLRAQRADGGIGGMLGWLLLVPRESSEV